MSIGNMDRKMAVRVFGTRAEELKRQARELPLEEKFRLVADLLESGQKDFARWVARLALREIDS